MNVPVLAALLLAGATGCARVDARDARDARRDTARVVATRATGATGAAADSGSLDDAWQRAAALPRLRSLLVQLAGSSSASATTVARRARGGRT